ncbi:hypothetical protein [Secundilactobacillus collinoides]|uniref:Uncharacterized protein n=1 Tax=Secundilactobacillus collinoides DSM 20515 = JCM 1123 TaxID=1423733 RepID=A0A0R2B9Z6_SECCO|nr:hypothetical protein [Secundilactobacillus collinoides]KRM75808.1 hypothetical protein FC82_GL001955 [Secundilactobacillus collinoides DSM 20515 = JCM 1123]
MTLKLDDAGNALDSIDDENTYFYNTKMNELKACFSPVDPDAYDIGEFGDLLVS